VDGRSIEIDARTVATTADDEDTTETGGGSALMESDEAPEEPDA
jgi:hypothetical protein